jgi:hypothetical protein
MVRARCIALPHERQIWSDLMWSRAIGHNANFSTGPPDVQKSTQIHLHGATAEAVIRSVELIVQPDAHDFVGKTLEPVVQAAAYKVECRCNELRRNRVRSRQIVLIECIAAEIHEEVFGSQCPIIPECILQAAPEGPWRLQFAMPASPAKADIGSACRKSALCKKRTSPNGFTGLNS